MATDSVEPMNEGQAAHVKNVYRKVRLVVRGIAPRCRKVDHHSVALGTCPDPLTPADRDRFVALARKKLTAFRSYDRAKVCFDYIERDGIFETYVVFDKRHIEVPLV